MSTTEGSRRRLLKSSRFLVLVCILALAVPATGIAAIPNNGVINACYNSVTGHARVVDGTQCLTGEVSLWWTQSAGIATDLVCTPPGCVNERRRVRLAAAAADRIGRPDFGSPFRSFRPA